MNPFLSDADFTLYLGDAVEALAELEPDSVDCVITSPPYYALRDYGTGTWEGGDPDCDHALPEWIGDRGDLRRAGPNAVRANEAKAEWRRRGVCKCGARRADQQIGSEPSTAAYIESLVEVFRGVRRALKPTGTVWLNLGDSFSSKQNSGAGWETSTLTQTDGRPRKIQVAQEASKATSRDRYDLPQKNLLGLPWRLAFALQDDGWWLRQCNIWSKPNPLPESATDRPGTAHEYVFMLTKSARYFYDLAAVKVPAKWERWGNQTSRKQQGRHDEQHVNGGHIRKLSPEQVLDEFGGLRNLRSVWEIPTTPNSLAVCEDCESFFKTSADAETHRKRTGHEVTQHFAAFPKKLVETCILAGSSAHGCCPECGKPWERVVEPGAPAPEPDHRDPVKRLEPGQAGNADAGNMGFRASKLSGQEMNAWRADHPDRTTGWRPTCEHTLTQTPGSWGVEYAPVPSVVMDPFMGSGTTALVARETGRRCVGIELRPAFARMSAWRLQQLSLLAEGATA